MLILNYKTETFELKNSLDEFTIGEFEKINSILNNSSIEDLDKWIILLTHLGVPERIIDELKLDEFKTVIDTFDLKPNKFKVRKTIIIDGIECRSYSSKFRVTVREAILIDEFIRNNPDKYLAEVVAIMYKSNYLSKEENYDKKVIKTKSKYIRENITADIAYPILNYIISKMLIYIPYE